MAKNNKKKDHTCRIEKITKSNTYSIKSNTIEVKSNTYSIKSNTIEDLTQQQRDVLEYCSMEVHTAKEIFDHLDITVQAKHYATYINALLQLGLLQDITPEKKRNKKYKTKINNSQKRIKR